MKISVLMLVLWLVIGVSNLVSSDEISKLNYGIMWGVLILQIIEVIMLKYMGE